MSTSVIKEFLVRLGYKVDSTGERKFVDGVKHVTEETQKLGLAAAATAAALTAAVVKMASNLEDLYFMSQRTKASAENIQALGFAASQMGSSVDGARGSIESLAKFLRENPGGEGLLGSIGVRTRDANGALRDTTEIMQDLGKRLAGMPQYRAVAYANVFGIDYKTLVALEQGVDKFSGRYKELLHRFGLNVDKATKQSHDLMVSWRDMKAAAGILSDVVGTTLIGVFDELQHRWESLDQTTRDNIKTGAEWVAGIVAGMAIVMGGPVVWIGALAAAILGLWDDYKVWKEGGKSLIDWGKWGAEVKLAQAGFDILSQVITELSGDFRVMAGVMEDAYNWITKLAGQIAGNPMIQKIIGQHDFSIVKAISDGLPGLGLAKAYYYTHADGAAQPAAGGATRGIRNNNPGNIKYGDFARRHGATGQDANGFAIFPDTATGLRAINANLSSYGNMGVNTPSGIAHRWSATDQDAYTRRLAGLFGGDPNKPLNMSDPAVLTALRNGIITQENGSNPYASEMLGKAGGATRGGVAGALSVDQNVTINLHGVDKPHEASQAVTGGLNAANDRLVRNLKPAVS